jgi:hypothetical protein
MKRIFLILAVIVFISDVFPQNNGTTIIYESGNYGISLFNSIRFSPVSQKSIYIQLGLYNYTSSANESGKYFKLNKTTGNWYVPVNGFLNAAWGMEYPYGTYDCEPIPFFAMSPIDTNQIIKYVVTPAASCPDAGSYYTTNGGVNYSTAPFGCGGSLLFPAGADYNIKRNSKLIFGFRNLSGSGYNISISTNAGVDWSVISSISDLRESSGANIWTNRKYGFLKYNPLDTAFVYANGLNNLFISTNGGYSFSQSNVKWFKNIIFSLKDSIIYGFNDSKLYKSANKGITWDSIQTIYNFNSFEVNPDSPNKMYGGDNSGVYLSTNYGNNWTLYNNSFSPSKTVIGISKDPGSLDTFYVATANNVYKVWASFVVGENIISTVIPEKFSLYQNYPNPFNPVTKIRFDIPHYLNRTNGLNTILKIYDIAGKELAILLNKDLMPGSYEIAFDGSVYSSGVYFYSLISGNYRSTKRLVLIK